MSRLSYLILTGLLAIAVGGCNLLPGGDGETASEATPVAAPTTPAETAAETEAADVAEEPFTQEEAVVAQQPPARSPDGLIRSTNPDERFGAVNRNRPDPFATVPVPPPPPPAPAAPAGQQLPQPQTSGATTPGTPGTQATPGAPGTAVAQPVPGRPGTQATPGQPGTQTAVAPLTPGSLVPNLPTLPELPQPELAMAVQVTGVIQVGNTAHAIVTAPEENGSRYVRVGQRLSNGQVLVKRIEMNAGSDPVVILEQNGVEVARTVGEGEPAEAERSAAAVLPASRTAPARRS